MLTFYRRKNDSLRDYFPIFKGEIKYGTLWIKEWIIEDGSLHDNVHEAINFKYVNSNIYMELSNNHVNTHIDYKTVRGDNYNNNDRLYVKFSWLDLFILKYDRREFLIHKDPIQTFILFVLTLTFLSSNYSSCQKKTEPKLNQLPLEYKLQEETYCHC